ncbi:hypothetical protein IT568_06855, partial [bacterium]|nr:hypothetical protein [bacterium]
MSEKPKLKSLLLVASKNPLPGNVKTRLSPPLTLEDSALLYSCFLQDLVERLLKLKNVKITVSYSEKNASDLQNLQKILPYKQLSFEKQNGESLGEKLKNCFEFYFSQGFEKIVVIG